jgi:hypothetical protein
MSAYFRLLRVICFRTPDLAVGLCEAFAGLGTHVRSQLMRHAIAHQEAVIAVVLVKREKAQP